jgi:hypothetical protein
MNEEDMGLKDFIEQITSQNVKKSQSYTILDEKSGRRYLVELFPTDFIVIKIQTYPAGKPCSRCKGTGREPAQRRFGHP